MAQRGGISLLAPTGMQRQAHFAAQLPLLRRSFHCYLPDARGHATTRWDAGDGFRYDWLVDDLEALKSDPAILAPRFAAV